MFFIIYRGFVDLDFNLLNPTKKIWYGKVLEILLKHGTIHDSKSSMG